MPLHEDPLAPSSFHVMTPHEVKISRKDIFDAVAKKIGLSVHKEMVLPLGNNDFVANIQILGIPTRILPVALETKDFYGGYALTESLAIEAAYSEALKQLEDTGIIAINDCHYSELARTKSELLATHTWLMFTEDSHAYLEGEIEHHKQGWKEALSDIDTIILENSKILPVSMIADPENTEKNEAVYTGPPTPVNPLDSLAEPLVYLRKQIARYDYERECVATLMRRPQRPT